MPTIDFLRLQLQLKGIWQKRQLGQNFLFDEALLTRIADAARLDPYTLAVEIGPGAGTLTSFLAPRAGGLLAIEFDQRLRPLHADAFGTDPSIRFHYDDVLKVDLQRMAREEVAARGLQSAVLVGNLPFQITSPLLFGQCGQGVPWRRMALMVQKEVADRVQSPPGPKAYGILTVKLAYWWKLVERFDVPASCFTPRPNVDAAVLVFEPLPAEQTPSPELWKGLSPFIDAAFGQRRKMLVNGLAARWPGFPGKEECRGALSRLGFTESVRGECLSPDQFRRLYDLLSRRPDPDSAAS